MPRSHVRRQRDAGATLRRFRSVDAKIGDDGVLRLVASTDAAVRFGSWREILTHSNDAIERGAAHALLVNHDPNQIAGTIRKMEISGGELRAEVEVMAGAKLASGIGVREAVNAGALRGVSIGYTYAREDATWNEQERTVTVKRWRLLEVTLTPIPADADAGVRSCPFDNAPTNRADRLKDPTMQFEQWLAARGFDAAKLSDAEKTKFRAIFDAGGLPPEGFAPHARTQDEAARAAEIAKLRAERDAAVRETKLRTLAQEHGVDTKDIDFAGFKDESEGLRALLARKAKAEANPPADQLVVTRDAGDKLLEHVRASLHMTAGTKPDEGEKVAKLSRGMNAKAMLRALARASGESGADYWSDAELGMWAQGAGCLDLRSFGRRDAANKISAQFGTILANVATKAVMAGMNGYNGATWQQWCVQRSVPNFLAVSNVGLASGRLTKTNENEAFPELTQKDGGYNSSLGLYGATVSLTWQALVNDQLGMFMQELRRSGAIAALTIDRRVYYVLLNATWTNDLSSSAGLSTLANLDKPRSALRGKLSPANEKMGIVARFLLHDPANAFPAQQATGALYAPGQTTAPSLGTRQIVPIESHWIGDTSLYGSALTTDYYLAGDPSVIDTVLVNTLEGVGLSPIIMPFDPGAVAAEKWKMMLPFEATIATHTDGAATPATRITGMQKAQA